MAGPVTRTKNADEHPGLIDVDKKRKRRTKAEMAADREQKAEADAAKKLQQQQAINTIAQVENKMAVEDANDVTPRPTHPQVPYNRRLRRTASVAQIPLYAHDNEGSDGACNEAQERELSADDDYQDDGGYSTDTADSIDNFMRPQKKAKVPSQAVKPVATKVDASDRGGDVPMGSKPQPKPKPVKISVRDTVKAARGEPARRFDALGEGEQLAMVGKGEKMQPDKAKNTPQLHVEKTYVLRISTMGYRQC
jgi:hypothetical protein